MAATGELQRIERLSGALRENGVDAFLAWHPVTMGYLQGFHEGGGERFLALAISSDGKVAMICPALSATQAKRVGIGDIRAWRDGENALDLFGELAKEWNLRSAIIAVDDEMPAHMVLRMQEALPAALFKLGHPILSQLMRVKDERELAYMQQAADIADQAFAAAINAIRPGVTEIEVSNALSEEMRRLGGKPSFCIVATDEYGAEPHHVSDDSVIREGSVIVIDYGCSIEGYQSDVTRTVSCSNASDEAKKIYDIVYRSHMAARAGVRPGVTGQDIDRLAREVIEREGYGEFFMHRTGHGIGMRGHEEPNIVEGNDLALEPGNCFSIEPGIYLPGKFGVRIETIVRVTDNGHVSFNEDPLPAIQEVC